MELEKLTKDEIWSSSADRLREIETDIRKELAMANMQIFNKDGKIPSAKKKQMKKNLARVLTKVTENSRNKTN
mgnify:CR=1 FL=1